MGHTRRYLPSAGYLPGRPRRATMVANQPTRAARQRRPSQPRRSNPSWLTNSPPAVGADVSATRAPVSSSRRTPSSAAPRPTRPSAWPSAPKTTPATCCTTSPLRGKTVGEFWTEWTTDPLWPRPAESTNMHNRRAHEGVRRTRYGDRPLRSIDALVVAEWLKGGRNLATVPVLCTMFNDARRVQAGRLDHHNPFAGLGIKRSQRPQAHPAAQARRGRAPDRCRRRADAALLRRVPVHRLLLGDASGRAGRSANGPTSTSRPAPKRSASSASRTRRCASSRRPSTAHSGMITMIEPLRDRLLVSAARVRMRVHDAARHATRRRTRTFHWNRVRSTVGLGNDGAARSHAPLLSSSDATAPRTR